jgi:hypothetical protein
MTMLPSLVFPFLSSHFAPLPFPSSFLLLSFFSTSSLSLALYLDSPFTDYRLHDHH